MRLIIEDKQTKNIFGWLFSKKPASKEFSKKDTRNGEG